MSQTAHIEFEDHQGYSNYETWSVSTLLDGNLTDAHTYREVNALVDDVIDQVGRHSDELPVRIWDALKGYVERHLEPVTSDYENNPLAAQLVSGVLADRVNWRELVDEKITDHDERQ